MLGPWLDMHAADEIPNIESHIDFLLLLALTLCPLHYEAVQRQDWTLKSDQVAGSRTVR